MIDCGKNRYWTFTSGAGAHSLTMMLRRKRVILAALVALLPVTIPLALPLLSREAFAEDGSRIFKFLMEGVYLKAMAPLLALFFGCMLIGEDVELQTMPYVLTRPIPRSALVLGRFGAYVMLAGGILLVSVALTFAACTAVGSLKFTPDTLKLLAHYGAVGVAALLGYGSLTMFLGAVTRRPIILGVMFIFGWQKIAMIVPGAVDFLTIDKYITALLPVLATQRQNVVIKTALMEFQKNLLLITATKAAVTLAVIIGVLFWATCLVVRYREYSQSRTAAG